MTGFAWTGNVPLRWRDLDAFGHVYHGEYLVLLDQARMAMFASALGHEPQFVLARLEIDYRRPVVLADGPLAATVEVEQVGRTSVTMHERLETRAAQQVLETRCVVVFWDLDGQVPRLVTDAERARLFVG